MKQRYKFDVEFVKYALNFLFVDDFNGGACDFKKALHLWKWIKNKYFKRVTAPRKTKNKSSIIKGMICEGEQRLERSKMLEVIWDDKNIFRIFCKTFDGTKRNDLPCSMTLLVFYNLLWLILRSCFKKFVKINMGWRNYEWFDRGMKKRILKALENIDKTSTHILGSMDS